MYDLNRESIVLDRNWRQTFKEHLWNLETGHILCSLGVVIEEE